jgi:glutathione S-transferase
MAVQAMLEHKGIDFVRADLVPFLSRVIVRRGMGMPQNTVPVLAIGGRRVQGSCEISRELERLRPEPPLFPGDPDGRLAVETAEAWGEEELQHPIRQVVLWATRTNPASIRSYMEGSRMGVPVGIGARLAPPFIAAGVRVNEASGEAVRANLAGLDGLLQRVDEWIDAGVLDGEQLNAADFQIGASVRLLLTLQDLRPLIEDRHASRLARRAIPDYPGDVPPVIPPVWLEPLRSVAAAR